MSAAGVTECMLICKLYVAIYIFAYVLNAHGYNGKQTVATSGNCICIISQVILFEVLQWCADIIYVMFMKEA